MFYKTERSSFKYWFAYWYSFNMVTLNQKCWKFKYLFHDMEKPFQRNAKQKVDAQYLIYKNDESKYIKQIVEKYSDYFNEIIDENGNSRYYYTG